jgi:hypothetical protein
VGHERIGLLPKTRRWRDVVDLIAIEPSVSSVANLVESTLEAASERYSALSRDESTSLAIDFFVELARSSQSVTGDRNDLANLPTLALVSNVQKRLSASKDSSETREIVRHAVADALVKWQRDNNSTQVSLFAERAPTWTGLGTGAGFCELSRHFFASLTDRYLRYFLEREATAQLTDIDQREEFSRRLTAHVDDVSKHAFETAKITQSFAAAWFEKYARNAPPTPDKRNWFVKKAFSKLREDFRREKLK